MTALRAILRIPWLLWFLVAGGLCYMDYAQWQTDIYQPLIAAVEAKKADLVNKKAEVAKAEDFKVRRDEKLGELQDLGQKLDATKKEMPRSASVPDLLRSLADISDQAGLEVSKFHPDGERRRRFLVETPISVSVKGTYLQIMSFLDAAANMGRFVATEKISFDSAASRGSVSVMAATVTLITYYLDEGAMDAPAPAPTNVPLNQLPGVPAPDAKPKVAQ